MAEILGIEPSPTGSESVVRPLHQISIKHIYRLIPFFAAAALISSKAFSTFLVFLRPNRTPPTKAPTAIAAYIANVIMFIFPFVNLVELRRIELRFEHCQRPVLPLNDNPTFTLYKYQTPVSCSRKSYKNSSSAFLSDIFRLSSQCILCGLHNGQLLIFFLNFFFVKLFTNTS